MKTMIAAAALPGGAEQAREEEEANYDHDHGPNTRQEGGVPANTAVRLCVIL
jgi:hypothetical protein